VKKFLAAASLLALSISPAFATTYIGTRTAGTATANLSITTDGTVGTLARANITDWLITLMNGANSFTLRGPLSGGNSQLLLVGTGLSATATDLSFNFSSVGSFALFQNPNIGSGQNWYCPESISANCAGSGVGESINVDSRQNTPRTGNIVLASVVAGGVPEPLTWAMMLTGFGIVGGTMRYRRRAVAVTFA
jgi:hypothetical protein